MVTKPKHSKNSKTINSKRELHKYTKKNNPKTKSNKSTVKQINN